MFIGNQWFRGLGRSILYGNCSGMTQEWSWKYWKSIRDHFQCKSNAFEHIFYLKLIFYKIWEFWSDISTSTNKSRPGTHFKMCSRSWQYWRFEYHQKLLTQKWSCALRKLQNVNLGDLGNGVSFDRRTPCLDHVWELKVPGNFYSGAAENHDFVVRRGLGPLKAVSYTHLRAHET